MPIFSVLFLISVVAQAATVFFGTFDPPHLGHRNLVTILHNEHPTERIFVIPNHKSFHKSLLTAYEHRLAMVRISFATNNKAGLIEVLSSEDLGIAKAIDTLTSNKEYKEAVYKALKKRTGQKSFGALMGWDSFANLTEMDFKSNIGRFYVVARGKIDPAKVPSIFKEIPVQFFDRNTFRELSGSLVRLRLNHGNNLDISLSSEVLAYIVKHKLYHVVKSTDEK